MRSRRWVPPVGRAALVALAVLVAGCSTPSAPPPPNMSPGFPAGGPLEVHEGDDGMPVFTWERPGARRVVVNEPTRGDVVWQIDAAETPNGTRAIASPLAYGAPALPPGVNPPDGPDYLTTFGPLDLVPGDTYSVTVWWEGERRSSTTFTAPG